MLKNKNGITLIAMVITIIVMLILAGISIATLAGENGVINRTTKAKAATRAGEIKDLLRIEATNNKVAEYQNEKQKTRSEFIAELVTDGKLSDEEVEELQSAETPTITIGGIALDFSILPESVQVWTQSGTSVTDGKITLTVGTQVTGYSVTGHTDLNWYVLGAKDGKLLITTNTCPETVNLAGTAGFTNADGTGCPWVDTLNDRATKYSNGDMADNARTIDFGDIKRIDSTLVNSSVGEVYEYGNKVTYTLKASSSNASNKVIWYRGEKQPTTETETSITSFQYWGENSNDQWDWITLGDGESVDLDCTYEAYNASSIDSSAKTLLFTNTGNYPGDTGSYWLGSPYVFCSEGIAYFGLHGVYSSYVGNCYLFYSSYGSISHSMGLRPVVSLKSSVKVTGAGVVSK